MPQNPFHEVPERSYVKSILFVVFCVEIALLVPWAVKFKALGLFGLVEVIVFAGILAVAYLWTWKKGTLE
jgi:NADH-quinone oxidoreductase subunit A